MSCFLLSGCNYFIKTHTLFGEELDKFPSVVLTAQNHDCTTFVFDWNVSTIDYICYLNSNRRQRIGDCISLSFLLAISLPLLTPIGNSRNATQKKHMKSLHAIYCIGLILTLPIISNLGNMQDLQPKLFITRRIARGSNFMGRTTSQASSMYALLWAQRLAQGRCSKCFSSDQDFGLATIEQSWHRNCGINVKKRTV